MLQLLLFVVQASRATPASAAMEENDLARLGLAHEDRRALVVRCSRGHNDEHSERRRATHLYNTALLVPPRLCERGRRAFAGFVPTPDRTLAARMERRRFLFRAIDLYLPPLHPTPRVLEKLPYFFFQFHTGPTIVAFQWTGAHRIRASGEGQYRL
jgi:hypothetical protein